MTCQEIYSAALRLICENEEADVSDYEDRAPYLLGNFYAEQIPLQKKLDAAKGEEPVVYPTSLVLDLDEEFPLSDEFLSPATYYLAAMLVLDENESMSDRLFDRYIDGVASLAMSLPTSLHPIRDRYNCLI